MGKAVRTKWFDPIRNFPNRSMIKRPCLFPKALSYWNQIGSVYSYFFTKPLKTKENFQNENSKN